MTDSQPPLQLTLAVHLPLLSHGLRVMLEAGYGVEVVAESDGPGEALRYLRGHKPSVVVFTPDGNGYKEMLQGLPEASPETSALALIFDFLPSVARELLRDGARGVVMLEESADDFITALRLASNGDGYMNPRLAAEVASLTEGSPDGLSEREVEVLRLVSMGFTNREIADKLFLSVRTVESHRASIFSKLGLERRSDLVRYAMQHHLMPQLEELSEA